MITDEMLSISSVKDKVSEAEWKLRVDLAACYRAVALYGLDDLIFTHISARVPGDKEQFLINPYGMLFEEITASSLVKVDLNGSKVMDSPFPINPAGFVIHSAIHEARPGRGMCFTSTLSKRSCRSQSKRGVAAYFTTSGGNSFFPRLSRL